MRKMKSLVLAVIGLLCSLSVSAFEVDGIYYRVTNSETKTVEVTYKGSYATNYDNEYSGLVIIPDSISYNGEIYRVTSIGSQAFYNCSDLIDVRIPNSVIEIAGGAFDGTRWYNRQPDGVVYAGNVLYKYKGELPYGSRIEIPEGIVSISDVAFYECSGLKSIVFPNSLQKIGKSSFAFCWGLRTVVFPKNLTTISDVPFYDCGGIENIINFSSKTIRLIDLIGTYQVVTLKTTANIVQGVELERIEDFIFEVSDGEAILWAYDGVNNEFELPRDYKGDSYKIGEYAFCGWDSKEYLTIPNSVTSIGDNAFLDCSNLKSIVSHITAEDLFPINYNVFNDVNKNICKLYVPFGAKETYTYTKGWWDFTSIEEMPLSYDLKVSDTGYATLYLDYTTEIPEGVEVYTAKEVNGSWLKLALVEDVLPANTGVLVKAPQGTYTFTITSTEVPVIEDNLFQGSAANEMVSVPSGKTAFVLSKVDGEVGMYLAKLTDGRFLNNANKAYLLLDNNKLGLSDEELDTSVGGAQLSLRFDFGSATGIDAVQTETEKVIYDLYGRKVNQITGSGLYIIGGKKVYVR